MSTTSNLLWIEFGVLTDHSMEAGRTIDLERATYPFIPCPSSFLRPDWLERGGVGANRGVYGIRKINFLASFPPAPYGDATLWLRHKVITLAISQRYSFNTLLHTKALNCFLLANSCVTPFFTVNIFWSSIPESLDNSNTNIINWN